MGIFVTICGVLMFICVLYYFWKDYGSFTSIKKFKVLWFGFETYSPEEIARAEMMIKQYPSKEKLAEQIASLLAIIASLQAQLQKLSK